MSAERLGRLNSVFQDYVETNRLPGAVTLVARHGKIVHLGAYGQRDREADATMTADTIFRIASQTKAVVSVAIMMLQEDGRLLIDDPLGNYLPEFAQTTVAEPNEAGGYDIVPAKRPITVRDLLRHTSGYDYGSGPAADRWKAAGIQGWYFADRDEPIRETIRRLAALPAAAHPGERYVYGYSTDILGVVIEVVSGQTLAAFLQERIFDPLGMTDTHFYLPESKRDRLAAVYSLRRDKPLERAPDAGTMVRQEHCCQGH